MTEASVLVSESADTNWPAQPEAMTPLDAKQFSVDLDIEGLGDIILLQDLPVQKNADLHPLAGYYSENSQAPGYVPQRAATTSTPPASAVTPSAPKSTIIEVSALSAATATSKVSKITTTPVTKSSTPSNYVWTDPSDCIDMQKSSFRGAFGPNSTFEEASNPQVHLQRPRNINDNVVQASGLSINSGLRLPSVDSGIWIDEVKSTPAPTMGSFMMLPNATGNMFAIPNASADQWLKTSTGCVIEEISPTTASPIGSVQQQALASPAIETYIPMASSTSAPGLTRLQMDTFQQLTNSAIVTPVTPFHANDISMYGNLFGHSDLAAFVPSGQDTASFFASMQAVSATNLPFASVPIMNAFSPAVWVNASCDASVANAFPAAASDIQISDTFSGSSVVPFINTPAASALRAQFPVTLTTNPAEASNPALAGVPTIAAMTKTMMTNMAPPTPSTPKTKQQELSDEMKEKQIEFNEIRKRHMARTDPMADGNGMMQQGQTIFTSAISTSTAVSPLNKLPTSAENIAPKRSTISPVSRTAKRQRFSVSGPAGAGGRISSPLSRASTTLFASPVHAPAQASKASSSSKKLTLSTTVEENEGSSTRVPEDHQPKKKAKFADTRSNEAGEPSLSENSKQSGVPAAFVALCGARNNYGDGLNLQPYEPPPDCDYESDSSDDLPSQAQATNMAGMAEFFLGRFPCYDDLLAKPEAAPPRPKFNMKPGYKKEIIPVSTMSFTVPEGTSTAITILNRTFVTHLTDDRKVDEVIRRVTMKFQAEAAEAEARAKAEAAIQASQAEAGAAQSVSGQETIGASATDETVYAAQQTQPMQTVQPAQLATSSTRMLDVGASGKPMASSPRSRSKSQQDNSLPSASKSSVSASRSFSPQPQAPSQSHPQQSPVPNPYLRVGMPPPLLRAHSNPARAPFSAEELNFGPFASLPVSTPVSDLHLNKKLSRDNRLW
ncbi:hypothetical protein SEUCBS140593_002262 [Sporothrix eucalyptigena]|uniref:Uncharacterized protein n=1 Tax=Sporothrix eucalyptigena TaxID=1812306 RepID=A0ABP0B583_9PEZI